MEFLGEIMLTYKRITPGAAARLLTLLLLAALLYGCAPETETVADENARPAYQPPKTWVAPDLTKMALDIYEETYIVRPKLDENFQVVPGQYELFEREDIASDAEAARVYVQGAAMQEYQLACVRRGSVFSNRSAGRVVALTFDDGLFKAKTPKILEILQEHDARATFFALGRYVENNPDLAQQVLAAGCELGSHSWFHAKQTALSAEERAADFARVAKAFGDAVGSAPYLFRAPYGAVNDEVKQDIAGQNMISVLWSLDTEDWRAKSADAVYDSVMNVVKPGDIILMHENGEYTLEALPRILEALAEQNYEVVTVSELVYAGSDVQAEASAARTE